MVKFPPKGNIYIKYSKGVVYYNNYFNTQHSISNKHGYLH